MAIQGPTLINGVSRNNQFSASWAPSVLVPAGAMAWVIGGTNLADTETAGVTDSAGNEWINQAFVQPPGIPGTILVAYSMVTAEIPTSGTITILGSQRANWDLNGYFHTGAGGNIFSTDVRFVDTSTNPTATVVARPGMTLFGTIGVGGPSADGFTNDPLFLEDQKGNIARTNVTIHASGRAVPSNADDMQLYSYAPTLGTARRSLIFLAAFQ